MKRITEYLDEIRAARNLPSDYALAAHLEVGRAHLSNWRNEVNEPDTYHCARIADDLGIDHREVIAAASAARARRQKKIEQVDYWESLWRRVRQATAAAIIAGLVVPVSGVDSKAYAAHVVGQESLLYAVRRWLARFLLTSPHAAKVA